METGDIGLLIFLSQKLCPRTVSSGIEGRSDAEDKRDRVVSNIISMSEATMKLVDS